MARKWKKDNLTISGNNHDQHENIEHLHCLKDEGEISLRNEHENVSQIDQNDDELLVLPKYDKRKPISTVPKLNIYQAYGLSPRTAEDKSMFRRAPYNPKRFERPLSPGSQIGAYKRSPKGSLRDLSPRLTQPSVLSPLGATQATVMIPALRTKETTGICIPRTAAIQNAETCFLAQSTTLAAVVDTKEIINRSTETTAQAAHTSPPTIQTSTQGSLPRAPTQTSDLPKDKTKLSKSIRTNDSKSDSLLKHVSSFQKLVLETTFLEFHDESTSHEVLG